ncbi:hypothetical protein [Rhizobium sp. CF142]|uniref:hypothetical protein n=1 Tax=Rhizobium sp. CF142 TaxID=1144314 RepID=UPI00026EFEFB|nr:hypothetical protein [Rhizobium sp. CF142]EJJ28679.1 hypothetical protein PMI11_03060 [Rhizobium sp. CF142]
MHVHPFPARMAPEIALANLRDLPAHFRILDPMSGSGMVVSQASESGLAAWGFDIDPLARLISKVSATVVDFAACERLLPDFVAAVAGLVDEHPALPWIDSDKETEDFIKYWFGERQARELRAFSYLLVEKPFAADAELLNVFKIALSRLIVTKEPKASLARDTAHSRPHKVIQDSDFEILKHFSASVAYVLKILKKKNLKRSAVVREADARKLTEIEAGFFDQIITSPPYLNAIDYMRGHKFSLIWFGYKISELRDIRSMAIGSEKMLSGHAAEFVETVLEDIVPVGLAQRELGFVRRYIFDILAQVFEARRVLRDGGKALYVVGNSSLRGQYIKNSEILKRAAEHSGMSLCSEAMREIPDNRRYLPMSAQSPNSLSRRMRYEHLLEFQK